MIRDMKQTADKARSNIPGSYDLNSTELSELLNKARQNDPNETYDAIVTAFMYGFVMGHRATLAGKVKKHL